MRDVRAMKRIDDVMRRTGSVIQIVRHPRGQDYYLEGAYLNGQIVRDMIRDGWLIESDSSIYRK